MKPATVALRDQLLTAVNRLGIATTPEVADAVGLSRSRYNEAWRNLQALHRRGVIGKERFDGVAAAVWTRVTP